jgi:uncharacterized protein (DUF1499 family)
MASLFKSLSGTTSDNFPDYPAADIHPLPGCPDSPNCARISVPFRVKAKLLYELSLRTLIAMQTYKITENSEKRYIQAVFRIRVFGFKDDFEVQISPGSESSVLHLKSASRAGYSDLGVNRRRILRFLERLNSLISGSES